MENNDGDGDGDDEPDKIPTHHILSVGRKPAPRRHVLPRCKSIPLNQHYGHASSDGKLGSFFSGPML